MWIQLWRWVKFYPGNRFLYISSSTSGSLRTKSIKKYYNLYVYTFSVWGIEVALNVNFL